MMWHCPPDHAMVLDPLDIAHCQHLPKNGPLPWRTRSADCFKLLCRPSSHNHRVHFEWGISDPWAPRPASDAGNADFRLRFPTTSTSRPQITVRSAESPPICHRGQQRGAWRRFLSYGVDLDRPRHAGQSRCTHWSRTMELDR